MAATGVVRPKTHRGKRAVEQRASKDVENTKTAMFIRGGRTSEMVTQAMKDLCLLKKPNSVMFQRKNIMRPFEDHTSLEFFSVRNDASLFLFGSHSKKRPHNLVIGRCFDGHILDMVELGIDKFISLNQIKAQKCSAETKPCLLFSGQAFENDAVHKRLKSILIDFYRGPVIEKVRLQGLEHVLQFTAEDGKIYLRSYRVLLKKSGSRTPRVEVEEMGPSLDLVLRRTHLASDDLMRTATKVPRVVKPKKVKNMSYDVFGTKEGQVHMQRQDYGKLQTRKMKGLKRQLDTAGTQRTNKVKKK
ncbi:rRNA-binding ribosome biosynthesis protein rpf2 [Desmophyllum pertusum]|uniref:Ribosome production factor 2 homolog n=1 Tax=Desmophyllum pertusum TaxID=174260 RepID=A0A9W9YU80_9CNID|nr:rRNA-binding ribosome biosynthesis protein rpf2 [Desmophyllum pertusum]